MIDRTTYIIADCYPKHQTDAFRLYVGAIVGCWIKADLCDNVFSAEVLSREKLSVAGWNIARIQSRQQVSSQVYLNKNEGREFFEQAQIDGFVAHFHLRAREFIGDPFRAHMIADIISFADGIALQGGTSLYSASDGQWANGVTPQGDDFLPLWLTRNDSIAWLQDWPGYEPRDLSFDELQNSDVLDRINGAEMWIGLGIGRSSIVTCHPIWIKERIREVCVQK